MLQICSDENARLAALASYDILDTEAELPFDRIVRLVRKLLDVPMATVSFVDKDRQWFKAKCGIAMQETERKAAICDHTIRSHEPLVVPDLRKDPRFADLPHIRAEPPILSYLGVPLVTDEGYALGALCALDSKPHEFPPEHVSILADLAGLVVDWLEMRRLSQSDFLTGAMSRRAFRVELERRIAERARDGTPSSIALLDIDHFKRINDSHGHAAGDDVLKAVVAQCSAQLREDEVIARLGGEEFCLLLPGAGPDEASDTAERYRRAIAASDIPGLPDLDVTASFGVAPLTETYQTPEEWLHAADKALYRAKETGRNRCCMAEE